MHGRKDVRLIRDTETLPRTICTVFSRSSVKRSAFQEIAKHCDDEAFPFCPSSEWCQMVTTLCSSGCHEELWSTYCIHCTLDKDKPNDPVAEHCFKKNKPYQQWVQNCPGGAQQHLWRSCLEATKMWFLRRLLRTSWKVKNSNEEVPREANVEWELGRVVPVSGPSVWWIKYFFEKTALKIDNGSQSRDDDDVNDSSRESERAVRRLTRRCAHNLGTLRIVLGLTSSPCWPDAFGPDPAGALLQRLSLPCGLPVARICGRRLGFPALLAGSRKLQGRY